MRGKCFYHLIFISTVLCLVSWQAMCNNKAAKKPVVAVHDFDISSNLKKWGLDGWTVAAGIENQLVKTGRFKMVTRAQIGKVLKEQRVSSSGMLDAGTFGKLLGAEFIVTGNVDLQGNRLVIIAKLIDAKKQVGEIRKSFQVSTLVDHKEELGDIYKLFPLLCQKISMTPQELVAHGRKCMAENNYDEAIDAFNSVLLMHQIVEKTQVEECKRLIQQAKNKIKENQENFDNAISRAQDYLEDAKLDKHNIEKHSDAKQVCHKAIDVLNAFKRKNRSKLSRTQKKAINEQLKQINDFKKSLWNGPVTGEDWVVPGILLDIVAIKDGQFKRKNGNSTQTIELTQPFWIGKYEITIEQYLYFLKNVIYTNKEDKYDRDGEVKFEDTLCPITKRYRMKKGQGIVWGNKRQPMVFVSWKGAELFCRWLTAHERRAKRLPEGYEYRLPTEAEWEYCSRAGAETTYSFGDNLKNLPDYAWYKINSENRTHPVGSKNANHWGLHDMHGNVWEWCYDWQRKDYDTKETSDPVVLKAGTNDLKTVRGGSFRSNAESLATESRSSFRYKGSKKTIGFRIVCAPELE